MTKGRINTGKGGKGYHTMGRNNSKRVTVVDPIKKQLLWDILKLKLKSVVSGSGTVAQRMTANINAKPDRTPINWGNCFNVQLTILKDKLVAALLDPDVTDYRQLILDVLTHSFLPPHLQSSKERDVLMEAAKIEAEKINTQILDSKSKGEFDVALLGDMFNGVDIKPEKILEAKSKNEFDVALLVGMFKDAGI